MLPFLQVMAGFGAPLVWQVNKAVFPSVTVWSDGGNVNEGATPETQRENMRGKNMEKFLVRGDWWKKSLKTLNGMKG